MEESFGFNEFLAKFRQEDRDEILGQFIKHLLTGEKVDIVVRKSATLSILESDEDNLKKIADLMGRPVENLKDVNLEESFKSLKEHRAKLDELTKEYKDFLLTHKCTADKFQELSDVGRFIIASGKDFNLEIPLLPLEYPDFVIEHKGDRIGLEHTRMINPKAKENLQFVKRILIDAGKELLKGNPEQKGIVNIEIDYGKKVLPGKKLENAKFTSKEKRAITEILSVYLNNILNHGDIDRPDFVKGYSISGQMTHSLEVKLIETYLGKQEFTDLLNHTLISKEDRYSSYSSIDNFRELWLLVVIESFTGASSYIMNSDFLNKGYYSRFKQIYVLDVFTNDLYSLKTIQK